eukprot:CAMPEP_0203665942 /NCGR_PEP_ID=MMETSP0090-20130426/3082_1 /ASSEMBLY_ACC=CAM_ASM_001088 /TAXON_ID=426623 /ORGANISM="Chaetoceros affinis, Strain CCMP159" /LENGTH=197 /DNA_ID=CAMNT_0050529679 /DNA_START=61 /DNA_END=654 /DNA_ORIENTATION=-
MKSIVSQLLQDNSPDRTIKTTATIDTESSSSDEDSISEELFAPPKVKFSNICIREYQRTLGDNPAVSSGPPLSLDWEYDPNEQILSVEEYEKKNESGTKKQVRALSRFKREKILEEDVGITKMEMKASIREVTNIQQMRKITNESRSSEKSAERKEALQRKVSTLLRLRKSEDKEIEKLWQEAREKYDSGSQKIQAS